MLQFTVMSFLVTFWVRANAQNGTVKASSPLVSIPNFDSPSVYQVTQPVDHAEGPIWDGRKNVLYYVDIHTGRVLSYNYNTKKVNYITLKGDVSPVIPAKNNENILIVGVDRSVVAIEWDGQNELGSQRTLTTVSPQFPQSRFNDGKADKHGRVWIGTDLPDCPEPIIYNYSNEYEGYREETTSIHQNRFRENKKYKFTYSLESCIQRKKVEKNSFGTMGYENPQTRAVASNQGVLYKITRDTVISPKVEISPVNISNGLCWNKDNNKMYYIDSPTRKVVEYEYNEEKGEISNPKVAVDISKFPYITGVPDGMTIDKEDNLWIALYGGGAVIRANPRNGQLLQVIPIPARDVTSVAWGGPHHDILFVTTSRISLSEQERKIYHAAGSIFAITNLKTNGFPAFFADLVDTVRRANLLAEILLNTNELFAPAPPSEEVLSYPQLNVPQKKRNQGNDEVPFWMAMINTIRSIF